MVALRTFVARNWLIIALAAVAGCVWAFRAYSSGSPAALAVGDCFDVPGGSYSGAIIGEVRHRPCAEAHLGEVFFVGDIDGSASNNDVRRFVDEKCASEYRGYTGRDADADDTYVVASLTQVRTGLPTRGVACYAKRVDRQLIVGSIRTAQ